MLSSSPLLSSSPKKSERAALDSPKETMRARGLRGRQGAAGGVVLDTWATLSGDAAMIRHEQRGCGDASCGAVCGAGCDEAG